ncbi:unnamed protein product, partial [Scytosiphon promiscuus]
TYNFETAFSWGFPHFFCCCIFFVQALDELLQDDERFGFIVMDGNGTLYGTLQGRS